MADLTYTPDTAIMPALVELKKCLCDELEKSGLGAQCQCVIVHGDGTSAEPPAPGKAFAWIGLTSAFPSKAFPAADQNATSCNGPLAATVAVGVIRCYQINTRGESDEDMLKWMDLQMADMAAMRRAILCCGIEDVALGNYSPIGPEGGVYGGAWGATIGQAL